jgi:hypothetical protein
LGESDEKPFRPTEVAEPIRVFILDDFAYELRAARAEPFKRLVDVVHGDYGVTPQQRASGRNTTCPSFCTLSAIRKNDFLKK